MGQRHQIGTSWCAWDEGYMAHSKGQAEDSNPFDLNCDAERDDWEQWNMGWHDARLQQVEW